jgi:hypothetical protein
MRRSISDWLKFMELAPAGPLAELDRYIGYWGTLCHQPCRARSRLGHQGEVRNAAKPLLDAVLSRRDKVPIPVSELHLPWRK